MKKITSDFVNKFNSKIDNNRIYTKIPIDKPKKGVLIFLALED